MNKYVILFRNGNSIKVKGFCYYQNGFLIVKNRNGSETGRFFADQVNYNVC